MQKGITCIRGTIECLFNFYLSVSDLNVCNQKLLLLILNDCKKHLLNLFTKIHEDNKCNCLPKLNQNVVNEFSNEIDVNYLRFFDK